MHAGSVPKSKSRTPSINTSTPHRGARLVQGTAKRSSTCPTCWAADRGYMPNQEPPARSGADDSFPGQLGTGVHTFQRRSVPGSFRPTLPTLGDDFRRHPSLHPPDAIGAIGVILGPWGPGRSSGFAFTSGEKYTSHPSTPPSWTMGQGEGRGRHAAALHLRPNNNLSTR